MDSSCSYLSCWLTNRQVWNCEIVSVMAMLLCMGICMYEYALVCVGVIYLLVGMGPQIQNFEILTC